MSFISNIIVQQNFSDKYLLMIENNFSQATIIKDISELSYPLEKKAEFTKDPSECVQDIRNVDPESTCFD